MSGAHGTPTPVLRHRETGEIFSFTDGDRVNTPAALMRARGWDHGDVEWLADPYWALTWREDMRHWNTEHLTPEGAPKIEQIEGVGFLTPQPVHLASATASQYVEVVEYRAVWPQEIRDLPGFDEIDEYAYGELLIVDHYDDCHDFHRIIDQDQWAPRPERFTAVAGPYYVTHEEARDHASYADQGREISILTAQLFREFCQSNPPL